MRAPRRQRDRLPPRAPHVRPLPSAAPTCEYCGGALGANPWKYPFPQVVNLSARVQSAEDADAMATALQPPEDPAKHPCKKMRLGGRQNALPEEFCIAST